MALVVVVQVVMVLEQRLQELQIKVVEVALIITLPEHLVPVDQVELEVIELLLKIHLVQELQLQ